jgi:hypothetical protein
MGRYLKLAMTVTSGDEHMQPAVAAMVVEKKGQPSPTRNADLRVQGADAGDLAPCGSSDCGGCYDVGDGKKIHPPKCGQRYSDWLKRWEPRRNRKGSEMAAGGN